MESATPVSVAESWLSVDGAVLDFWRHEQRMVNSVRHLGGTDDQIAEAQRVMSSCRNETPDQGRFWPRVDWLDDGSFRCQPARIAPEPLAEIALHTVTDDPRTQPSIKGPDLAALAELRRSVHQFGADEAVIVTDDGHVLEGALSALVWWRGDTLCHVDRDLARVASTTEGWLLDRARAGGVDVVPERARPDDLAGCEVWALSALHGIRAVTHWTNGPSLAVPSRRDAWQRAREGAFATVH